MATPCKIRIIRPLNGVYPLYQPTVGKIYDAEFVPSKKNPYNRGHCHLGFCVLDIADKKIVVRLGEYELVEVLKPDNSGKADGERICEDCGTGYDGGPMARFCPTCKKKRLSDNAKKSGLCYTGGAAKAAKTKKGKAKK